MTLEAWVYEACGRVSEQTEATERRLSFEASRDVVGKSDELECAPKNELPGVENEGFVGLNLDRPSQIGLFLGGVNERVFVVIEKPEEAIALL